MALLTFQKVSSPVQVLSVLFYCYLVYLYAREHRQHCASYRAVCKYSRVVLLVPMTAGYAVWLAYAVNGALRADNVYANTISHRVLFYLQLDVKQGSSVNFPFYFVRLRSPILDLI